MNTRDLAYFKALVEQRNYTAVAEQFSVSQPTVTQAIQRLEKEFDTKLIQHDRAQHKTNITRSGQLLYEKATMIQHNIMLAHQEIEGAKQSKIRFGLPPTIGTMHFPRVAGKLLQAGLLQRLDVFETGSDELYSELLAGHIDIALLGSVLPMRSPELNVTHLGSRPFKIVVSPEHPLADVKAVSFKDLGNENFITLNGKFVHPKAFKAYCDYAGITPNVVYSTPDIFWIKSLIKANLGVAMLVSDAVTEADPLTSLYITDPLPERFNISVATRKDYVLTEDEERLVRILNEMNV